MKRSPPPASAHAQVGKRQALSHDSNIRFKPTIAPHEVVSASSVKESEHEPLKEASSFTTQASPASLSRLQIALQNFRSVQSARALSRGAAAPPTKVCGICMEQVSRDQSHPRRHCFFLCGHSTCGECWSKILDRQNAACPWCRFLLDDTKLIKKEGHLPIIQDDGTFIVHIQDRKGTFLDVPCCWSTTIGEILDFVAPLRVREFANLQFPRKNLQLGMKLNPGYLVLHEGHDLNDIGYVEGHQLLLNQRRLPANNSIVAARLEHHLGGRSYPDGTFTLKVRCYYNIRPEFDLEDVNKLMKLSEIGRMIKAKIKQDGCCVDGEPRNLEVWGNVDRGIWDQEATSLDMLRDQGHGKKGKIYYDFD